jgi:hypothetical protein
MKRALRRVALWLDTHVFDCRWHWLCNVSEE